MANYGRCIDWVLRLEDRTLRGLSVDLHDGAGLTRFGLTQRDEGDILPTNYFVSDGTKFRMENAEAIECAKDVYHSRYWVPISGTLLDDDEVAATLLSFAVNDGVSRGNKLIQRVVGVQDDGISGPVTVAAINYACQSKGAANVAESLREAQEAYYLAVLAAKPEDERFRNEWINRARAHFPVLP